MKVMIGSLVAISTLYGAQTNEKTDPVRSDGMRARNPIAGTLEMSKNFFKTPMDTPPLTQASYPSPMVLAAHPDVKGDGPLSPQREGETPSPLSLDVVAEFTPAPLDPNRLTIRAQKKRGKPCDLTVLLDGQDIRHYMFMMSDTLTRVEKKEPASAPFARPSTGSFLKSKDTGGSMSYCIAAKDEKELSSSVSEASPSKELSIAVPYLGGCIQY